MSRAIKWSRCGHPLAASALARASRCDCEADSAPSPTLLVGRLRSPVSRGVSATIASPRGYALAASTTNDIRLGIPLK